MTIASNHVNPLSLTRALHGQHSINLNDGVPYK